MAKIDGIHHIAVMAKDVKKHIEFFTDVLGCKLTGLFFMHGVPGAYHGFLELNPYCYFSLVQIPAAGDIPVEMGRTHAGTGAGVSAPGTMQHLALRVADQAGLLALRDRIRSRGVNVIGPIDHGICSSIYFAGPDHLTLEIAAGAGEMDAKRWVDPEVCRLTGISPDDLARYTAPARYDGEGGQVPQPAYDPEKPHLAYPEAVYKQILSMPDEVITKQGSYAEPPVAA